MKKIILFSYFVLFFGLTGKVNGQKLAAIAYTSGINSPIDLKHCGDDRLFVASRAGIIRVINADGTLRAIPFLDITSKISSATNSEEGFLGIAFSPDYKTSKKIYVDYTGRINGQLTSVIEEYKVSADSNVVDPNSALTILTQSQPFSNHNGGNLMFGKDGYLYINLGDGGGSGDPNGNGQKTTTFLGKILRIDVSSSSAITPYVIPPSNPFYNDATPGIKKEIWAYGLRNPWRSSVDKLTADLWIGDVGQNAIEEIDFQVSGASGGRNYGWNILEGNQCFKPSTGCNTSGTVPPIYAYNHSVGACITGGYVYRSAQSKALFGMYIFGDYVSKWIDGITQANGTPSGPVTHLITAAKATGNPVSFGEDRFGDQYILFYGNNTVYKLEDTSYLRRPKAYFTAISQGSDNYLFQSLQGRSLSYQWLRDGIAIDGATDPDYFANIPGNYTLRVTNSLGNTDTSDVFVWGTLPLKLISSSAQKINFQVKLFWSTASEENMSGFIIQRRFNNEASFSDIAFVPTKASNGNSVTPLNYSFTDSSTLNNQQIFYRLKMQDINGGFSFSEIQPIFIRETNYAIFPNPAKGQVNIFLNNFVNPVYLTLYNSAGKKVREQKLEQQTSVVNLQGLKGAFLIQIINKEKGTIIREKIVIE